MSHTTCGTIKTVGLMVVYGNKFKKFQKKFLIKIKLARISEFIVGNDECSEEHCESQHIERQEFARLILLKFFLK